VSGPGFIGGGATLFHEFGGRFPGEPGLRLRLDLVQRWAVSKEGEVEPDSAAITMQTVQLGLELSVLNFPFYVAPGFALHRFAGDEFKTFWTYSVPLTLGLRPRAGSRRLGMIFVPVVKATIHYFPAFGADDFMPLAVSVSRDAPEAVLQFSLGLDVRLP